MSIDPQKNIDALKAAEKSGAKRQAARPSTAKKAKRKPVNGQRNWGQTAAALAALIVFWLLMLTAFAAGLYYSDQVRQFFAALFSS